jgi:hypothetical protein
MIPKSMSSTLIGDGYRFSDQDHAPMKNCHIKVAEWHEIGFAGAADG